MLPRYDDLDRRVLRCAVGAVSRRRRVTAENPRACAPQVSGARPESQIGLQVGRGVDVREQSPVTATPQDPGGDGTTGDRGAAAERSVHPIMVAGSPSLVGWIEETGSGRS